MIPTPLGLKPKTKNLSLILMSLAVFIALSLFLLAIYMAENKVKNEQILLFQDYQLQTTAATARNIQTYLDNISSQSRSLAWWDIPNYLDGINSQHTIQELLVQFSARFEGAVSYIYLNKDQRVVAQKISPRFDEILLKPLYKRWINTQWNAEGNSDAMGSIPSFEISNSFQLASLFIPVFANDQFEGYLLTIIDLGVIAEKHIRPLRIGEFGAGFLLDQSGTIIFDPETEIVGRNIFDGLHENYPELLEWDQMVTKKTSGKGDYFFTVSQDDKTVHHKFAAWSSADFGNNRLTVIFSASEAEVGKNFKSLQWISLSFALIFGLFILITFEVFLKAHTRQLVAQSETHKQNVILSAIALEDKESMLSGVFAAFPDLGIILDAEGTYLSIFGDENLLYSSKDEMIGRKISDILPKELAQFFKKKIDETLKSSNPIEYVYEVNIHNVNYYIEAKMAPIRVGNKKPNKVVLVASDVTARKKAQKIAENALMHAENANLAKSEFLANISHELRTPLNAILGFAEIIKDEAMGPVANTRYIDYAHDIYTSGKHLLSLLNDILDLSKIEAGKFDIKEEIFDLHEIVKSCISLMQSLAHKKNITLEAKTTGTYLIKADKQAIRQILLNLLSNAIKFTNPAGNVALDLSMSEAIFIKVVDNGIGIAKDDIAKIMEPFVQVESAQRANEGGTGIGLPLTDKLVRLHGGYINIDSTLGKGTTVTVMIPKSRAVISQNDYEKQISLL